jgi:MraZ protein
MSEKSENNVVMEPGLFTGTYPFSLDPKKRLTIPSDWRNDATAAAGLYVFPDLNGQGFLNVYPAREMAQRLQSIRNLSVADVKGRQFARVLGSQSQFVTWDSAGRIRVNDFLLEYGRLTDQVVLAGAFDHFELWTPDLWKQHMAGTLAELGEAARHIGF